MRVRKMRLVLREGAWKGKAEHLRNERSRLACKPMPIYLVNLAEEYDEAEKWIIPTRILGGRGG